MKNSYKITKYDLGEILTPQVLTDITKEINKRLKSQSKLREDDFMGVLLGKVEAGVPLLKALDKVCRERTKDGKRSTFYTDRQILWRDPEVEKTPKDYTNPKHYQEHPSGVECIQITEHMNFCLGNAIKYVWRAGLKDSETVEKDLNKSLWYIAREMERLGLNCKWEPKK